MQLVLSFLFLFNYFFYFLSKSNKRFFYIPLIISCLLNPLLDNKLIVLSNSNLICTFFIYFFFTIVISLFPNFISGSKIYIDLNKNHLLNRFLIPFLFFVLLLNLFLVIKVILFVYNSGLDITLFKNSGGADDFLNSILNPWLLLICRIFSVFSWISLYLLCLSLSIDNKKMSFYYFVASLNIPLISLVGLSRSGLIYYLFSLFCIYIYSRHFVNSNTRKKLSRYMTYSVFSFGIIFSFITISRFSDYDYWWVYDQSGTYLDVLSFSIIYYFTSWINNTYTLFSTFNYELIESGPGYFSIFYYFFNLLDFTDVHKSELWAAKLGEYSTLFVGLPFDALVDIGVFGTLYLFFILFLLNLIVARLKFHNSRILVLIFWSQYFSLFYAGNIFSYFFVSLALLIMIFFNVFYLKVTI